jgi:hypothetical protein
MQTGYRLRQLFVTLLTFCEPAQPERLWQEFRHGICDDLEYRLRVVGFENPTEEQIYDYGLFLLDNLLHESGRSLKEWPTMPQPQHRWQDHFANPLIVEQLNYNPEDEQAKFDERFRSLNPDQLAARAANRNCTQTGIRVHFTGTYTVLSPIEDLGLRYGCMTDYVPYLPVLRLESGGHVSDQRSHV